jgi:mono/diheme cytochrome c family protein
MIDFGFCRVGWSMSANLLLMRVEVWSVFVLAMLAGPALADQPQDRGKALLTRMCGSCHAVGPTGDSPHAGAPAFRTIGTRYNIAELTDRMTDRLVSIHPDMPDFQFSEQDAKAVRSYLYSIQR